jgi:hypothetical protein
MNWNIQQLSWNKVRVPGMANAIARIIVGSNIDIVVIVEVTTVNLNRIMDALTNAINALQPAPRSYWLTSMTTGGEHYGFIVRGINIIRPLEFADNPNAPGRIPTEGTANAPFTDLHALNWTTWPVAFPAPAPQPAPARPRMGLINTFVTPENPRAGKIRKTDFGGQPTSLGGFSEGRGFRMPCLAIFVVRGPAGLTYLPIVVCHFAAVRAGRNFLAQQQVGQFAQLHIAQLFSSWDLNNMTRNGGYLDIDGAAVAVTNLILAGDFNINFRRNNPNGGNLSRTNYTALSNLTPTLGMGGSAGPAATPGAAPAVPAVPFNAFPLAPEAAEIVAQELRAACTTEGTILRKLPRLVPPPPPPAAPNTLPPPPANIRGGALDNFFYGGNEVNTAIVNFGAGGVDSGEIIDIPAHLEQPGAGGAPPNLAVNALQAHYAARHRKLSAHAPNLSGVNGVAPALTVNDRWIGARLVSDHLPIVIQIACP